MILEAPPSAGPFFRPERKSPMKPTLFMLRPGFADPKVGPGAFFCPHTATIEGVLAMYPALRERLEVRYVDFPRPRHALIELLGEANQLCPALVLPEGFGDAPIAGRTARGRTFYVGATEIAEFLAAWAGIDRPHP